MSEQLKTMKQALIAAAQSQMGNLQQVDTEELGEVIDMIKDIEEALYYCTITEAMEENKKEEKHTERHYYTEKMYPYPYYHEDRDMDRQYGRMYYSGNGNGNGGGSSNSSSRNYGSNDGYDASSRGNNARGGGTRGYQEREYMMRDPREGRSSMSRKTYMESKEMNKDKLSMMKDLEQYMGELSEDMTEMIQNASPEEKQLLQKKLNILAQKVVTG